MGWREVFGEAGGRAVLRALFAARGVVPLARLTGAPTALVP